MFPNVTVIDDCLTIENQDWDFVLHMIAYFPENGSFTDKLNALKSSGLNTDKINYLYIHQGINGALAKSSENELAPAIFKGFDRVFVGHYHDRTIIEGTNIEYIGASRQHNFGEDIYKGYTLLYRDGSQKFIQNKANLRYYTLDIQIEELGARLYDRLEELSSEHRSRIKVRVNATDSNIAIFNRDELLGAGASKVEIVIGKSEVPGLESSGLLDKLDNKKLQESYGEFCHQKNIDDAELGIYYLSKIEPSCGS